MSVTAQTPYNGYTANGATTVFPYGFLLLDTDDLTVTVDGVEKALTTDYTVSGLNNPSGGNVTFLVAPANGAKVLLSRLLTIQRLTDYQDNGDLFAATINQDLDRLWLALQQLQQNDIRSLKLPYETSTDQVIAEAAADRIGKLVSFDASGNMVLAVPADLSLQTVSSFIATLLDDADAAAALATLGALSSEDGTITLAKLAASAYGTSGANKLLQLDGSGKLPAVDGSQLTGIAGGSFKNLLINPSGAIYQRAVAATADDAYFADRWNMLTQTGTVTPSVLTAPEDGYPVGVRITQSQASAQRFGFSQIIEGINCKHLRGGNGALTPRIRISNSQAIRYAILGWTGTEDTVTSDVVLDWTSASYTAGGFFLGSNVSVLAVGAQTPSANTWTSLASISAALGSSFNNIIVMVWTEGTAAQNVTLDFDYVQFERGSAGTAFETRSYGVELHLCQRYYEVLQYAGTGASLVGVYYNASNFWAWWQFKARKRGVATIGGYGGATALNTSVDQVTMSASAAWTSITDVTAAIEL
jgi:hypothetical protein